MHTTCDDVTHMYIVIEQSECDNNLIINVTHISMFRNYSFNLDGTSRNVAGIWRCVGSVT